MATTPRGIRRDDFIKSVRPDPKSTEELVMLQGYIGDSDLDGHLRVYSDPTLTDSIDLPERNILYADPVSTEENPLGGSRLWVKKTTVFTTGDPRHANRVKSSFLEGDLMIAFGNKPTVPFGNIELPETFPKPRKSYLFVECRTHDLNDIICRPQNRRLTGQHNTCRFCNGVQFPIWPVISEVCRANVTATVYQPYTARINESATLTGYEGGFNPYMTGY